MTKNLAVVVDTNVLRIAEETEAGLRRCAGKAATNLLSARDTVIVLDSSREILSEYLRNADPNREPKAGAAFLKWVLTNLANPERCRIIELARHEDRGYHAFPSDLELARFDSDDRKFVATALKAECPLVVGLDTDYFEYRAPLESAGLEITFVCESELQEIAQRKSIAPRV